MDQSKDRNYFLLYVSERPLLFLYINLKWRAKFQISRLLKRNWDWFNSEIRELQLNFLHFSGYSTRLLSLEFKKKKEDQSLMSIYTILKFPGMYISYLYEKSEDMRSLSRIWYFTDWTFHLHKWDNSWTEKIWHKLDKIKFFILG